MDILMKYAKKKTVFILSSVLTGIVTLLYVISKFGSSASTANIDATDLEAIAGMIGPMITILQIIFYLFIVLALATAVLSGVYFFKKNKHDYVMLGEFIVSCINSALLLLSISGVNAICKLVRVALSGDYSSLMSMDSIGMLSSITSTASNLKYFMYLSIIVFILNIVLLLIVKKIININGFEFNFIEPATTTEKSESGNDATIEDTTTDNSETVNEGTSAPTTPTVDTEKAKAAAKNGIANAKAFFKTKNGKITLGVIAAVIICFGGYKIYDKYFNYTNIDLGKNITAKFDGKDGSGYLTDVESNIDYDKNNTDLSNFIDSTYVDYDFAGDLSNGDKVTVTVKYSAELAKAKSIKVTNDSKTFTVKGLIERYKKADKIPDKVVSQLEKEANEKIKDRYKDGFSFTYNCEFNSLWFAKGESDDSVIAVYKIDETYTSSFSGQQDAETYYAAIYVDDLDSEFLSDKSHYWYGASLYDSASNKLTDPNAIEQAIKDKFDDHTLEKIK